MMKNSKETFKYRLVYFFRFAGDAFFYPLLSVYLVEGIRENNNTLIFTNPVMNQLTGFPSQIATYIMMILPLVSIFINPVWGFLGKNIRYNRVFVMVFALIEGLLIMFLPHVGFNIPKVVILLIIISIFGQPIYTLLDSLSKVYTEINNMEFLSIRTGGTLSFFIGTILCGLIGNASGQDYFLLFKIAGILFSLTSISIVFITPLSYEEKYNIKTEDVKPDPKALFNNKNFYLVLFFIVFSFGAMVSFDTYIANFLKGVANVSMGTYNYIQAVFVIVEALVMLVIVKYGSKMDLIKLSALFSFMLISRWLVFAISSNGYIVVSAQMLRGIAMAIYLYIFLRLVAENTKIENISLACIIIQSVVALMRFIMTLASSKLVPDITNHSSYTLWYLMGIGFAISSLFYLYMLHLNKKSERLCQLK